LNRESGCRSMPPEEMRLVLRSARG